MRVVFATSLGQVVTDGTIAGTSVIKATAHGPGGFVPGARFASVGRQVVFDATAGEYPGPTGSSITLWTTDGTIATPVLTLPDETYYSDPPTEPSMANAGAMVSLGARALFEYSPLLPYNNELWSTDTTAAGTAAIPGIISPEIDPLYGSSAALNDGRLVFADYTGLDVTDGTAAGTGQLISGVFGHGYNVFHIASLGGIAVFGVSQQSGGEQIWRTDGTPGGTGVVTALPRAGSNSELFSFMSLGTKALFGYENGTAPFLPSLWVTDGTASGTFQLPGIVNPQFGANLDERGILVSDAGLVASDGSAAGTAVIGPETTAFKPTTIMATIGNEVMFAAGAPGGPANQLWETDGTAAGTRLIETLPDEGPNSRIAGIGGMTSLGDLVLFDYYNAADNAAVWTTDGTSGGTSVLLDNPTFFFTADTVATVPGAAAPPNPPTVPGGIPGGGSGGSEPSPGPTVPSDVIPCFAAGTRIATDDGEIAVELLREGDLVRTVNGRFQGIQWIGRRRMDCCRHLAPERVSPVRIAPHAFGSNRPTRAVFLSPDHSVFVDGVLIPVKLLINDTTIAQILAGTIEYFHIELARHDVILADGLPTETYLETGWRRAFENGGGPVQLHADFAPDEARVGMVWQSFAYAPLIGDPETLQRVRAKLRSQAAMLALDPEPRRLRA